MQTVVDNSGAYLFKACLRSGFYDGVLSLQKLECI